MAKQGGILNRRVEPGRRIFCGCAGNLRKPRELKGEIRCKGKVECGGMLKFCVAFLGNAGNFREIRYLRGFAFTVFTFRFPASFAAGKRYSELFVYIGRPSRFVPGIVRGGTFAVLRG
jgi:hypothetical protein